MHLLFHCPSNKNIWSTWNAFPTVCNLFNQNHAATNIIFQTLQVLPSEDAALFCCIILSIWKQRNRKIWSEVTDVQGFVFYRAKTLLENWKTSKDIYMEMWLIATASK